MRIPTNESAQTAWRSEEHATESTGRIVPMFGDCDELPRRYLSARGR
jgi:hypothetical protein